MNRSLDTGSIPVGSTNKKRSILVMLLFLLVESREPARATSYVRTKIHNRALKNKGCARIGFKTLAERVDSEASHTPHQLVKQK